MMNASKYLENVAIPDDDGIENVTINEAYTACQIEVLAALKEASNYKDAVFDYLELKISELERKLKNIKLK